jgi:quinol monooxygenase YgiN
MHLFLAAVLSCVCQAQEKGPEAAILRAVKEGLSDPNKPFTLVVKFKVKEGQGAKFEAAMAKNVKETRKEKGNLAYELSRSAKGSGYMIYERWDNLASLAAHLKTAHFKTAFEAVDPLLEKEIELDLMVPVSAGD